MNTETMLSIPQAAERGKTNPGSVLALIQSGDLRTVKNADGVKVYASEIDALTPGDIPQTGSIADALADQAPFGLLPNGKPRKKRRSTDEMCPERHDEFVNLVDLALREGYAKNRGGLAKSIGYSEAGINSVIAGSTGLAVRMLMALYGFVYQQELAAGKLEYQRRADDRVTIPKVAAKAANQYIAALSKGGLYDQAAELASWMATTSTEDDAEQI
jgi:hypothetical protein